MAKFHLKIQAIQLRKQGESVKEIAEKLGVSKGTVSLWVREIVLSIEQLEKLRQKMISSGEKGRLKGALLQKQARIEKINKYKDLGISEVGNLTERDFFIAGIALYWAEGSKKSQEFYFCNSDPKLIQFMISWTKRFFHVQEKDLRVVVGINESHRDRDEEVKYFWSSVTGIPLQQFRSTSFKKSSSKKVYSNSNEHFGTLGIRVLKGSEFYYRILGLIEALARQGSSTVEQSTHKA